MIDRHGLRRGATESIYLREVAYRGEWGKREEEQRYDGIEAEVNVGFLFRPKFGH